MNLLLPTGARPLMLASSAAVLMSSAALAQGPTVVSTSPARNATNVPTMAGVGITFSQAVSAGSAVNVRVFGSQRQGLMPPTLSGGGTSSVVLQPQQAFMPGELVSVTVPASVQSTTGTAVTPQVYQFVAAAGPSSGNFIGTTNLSLGSNSYPKSMRLADFNQDGNLDLATLDGQGNTVIVRPGNGQGGFGAATTLTVDDTPDYLAAADVNNDGKMDLVVACNSGTPRTVVVRLGNGTGGFTTPPAPNTTTIPNIPGDVILADLNADGNLDLLIPNIVPAGVTTVTRAVSVRLGDGAGHFSGTTEVNLGTTNSALAVGDVNQDGKLDFVVVNNQLNTLRTFLNDGTGNFAATGSPLTLGTNPVSVVLADFNADRQLDAATANGTGNSVSVSLGDGTGSFGTPTTLTLGSGRTPTRIVAADIDGDGDQDLAVANNGITGSSPFAPDVANVLVNGGAGSFTVASPVTVDAMPSDIALADINNDGALDLLTGNLNNRTISIRLNQRVLAAQSAQAKLPLLLYPNPAHGQLTLALPGAAEPVAVQLLNALGQVVRSFPARVAASGFTLPLQGLAPGVYAVRAVAKSGTATKQVVVE